MLCYPRLLLPATRPAAHLIHHPHLSTPNDPVTFYHPPVKGFDKKTCPIHASAIQHTAAAAAAAAAPASSAQPVEPRTARAPNNANKPYSIPSSRYASPHFSSPDPPRPESHSSASLPCTLYPSPPIPPSNMYKSPPLCPRRTNSTALQASKISHRLYHTHKLEDIYIPCASSISSA